MSFPGPFSHVVDRTQVSIKGHPMILHYGTGRPAHTPAPADRAYHLKTARARELFSLPTVFKNGKATTPAFPNYVPIRASFGHLRLIRMMRCKYEGGASEMFVELGCACGGIVAIQASAWRCNPPERCNPCAKNSKQRRRFAAGYFCVDEWPTLPGRK